MAFGMKISIQQCLHGYAHGHQILASSTDLAPGARRTLLFQSDLSGAKTNSGFETYLTSYPLNDSIFFVLAKTWYASEMPRPGCVWTHSLLIELADLGKIPELKSLLKLFRRPELNNYRFYDQNLEIESEELLSDLNEIRSNEYNAIAKTVYGFPDKCIIIDANSSETYESAIVELWSDQWPRLRRNFTFCTGALSLKSVGNNLFDLQVIPSKNRASIIRDNQEIAFVNFKETAIPSWLNTVIKSPKNLLRQFLWSFGADMQGERRNYLKLIELFTVLNEQKTDINTFSSILKNLLPRPENGKAFKNSIFGGKRNSGQFSEKDILTFLLTERNIDYLNITEYNLNERLLTQYENHNIELSEFIDLAYGTPEKRISDEIINHITLSQEDVATVFQENNFLISKLLPYKPELAYAEALWKCNYDTQKTVLNVLKRLYPDEFPLKILYNVLNSNSNIIFEADRLYGHKIVLDSLAWYNQRLNELLPAWRERIFYYHFKIFFDWLKSNFQDLHPKLLIDIFQKSDQNWVMKLPLSHHEWIDSYAGLRKAQHVNLPYISSLFLSKGLRNDIYGSDWIVTMTFADVYIFAENSELYSNWNMIPKDYDDYEENESFNPFDFFFKIWGSGISKKNKDIESWDYCEILIRTVSSKYYKNNWSPQSYLNTFNREDTFNKSLIYMMGKKKGAEFIIKVRNNLLKSKKINGEGFQVALLNNIKID
ncbi:hypothetical protein [Mucilaginibacter sp. 44-25]|uniref:GAP1-N1 domain-containing protein n=1 Tax=Mucilaginibacter sp. 44-25 TaxID=1895794 RepID=UPI0009662E58|nr:hypothetical protein [Mucilaginibacter sp. 44-25]OJW12786.1 MAG: hypothetical protein BGO48_02575 [Mucilaginibacter sp. 44-25]